MRLFNATPQSSGGAAACQDMQKPCLVSFNLFRQSIGAGIIHERLSVGLSVAQHERHAGDLLEHVHHAQARQRPSHHRVRHQPLRLLQRPRSHPTNFKNTVNDSFFPHDDFTCKRKKFHIVPEVYKLADSDNDNVRDLNANECGKDGLKSKSIENARVRKGEGKLCHVLMVGAKLTGFAGNITCGCPRLLAT